MNKQAPRRILVIDDHLDTAHSAAAVLRHMGHEVEFAINGYAALRIAERFRPQVVILDMHLPDFDGADLSRLLRLGSTATPVRIVAITGKTVDEARKRATQAGIDDFLPKPVDWRELEKLVEK